MFKKISLTTLVLLIAISATACGAIQPPATTSTDTQSNAASSTQSDQATQSSPPAPSAAPQVGLNGKGSKGNRGEAALLQILNRLGWEGGVITKISTDQITLRTIERPRFENNPGQNQPGQNQPNANRKDFGRVETVNVNSSTIILVPGKNNATLSDLHVGDRVLADVPRDQKFAALVLSAPRQFDKDNAAFGMVTSNTNGTLTLRSPGGGDTVNTTATTQVFKVTRDGVTPGTVSDIQKGNLVLALGSGNDDNFTAQVILALPQGALELGKGLGNGKKNSAPQQPAAPNPGG